MHASLQKNVLFSWLAHGTTLGIGFLLMPYILHTVGETTYGTWLFLNSIAGQTGLLYLGFGDAISRFTAKYVAEKNWTELNRVASCITSVYCGSAGVALLAAIGLAWAAPAVQAWSGQSISEIQLVIVLLGLNAAVSIAGSSFGGLLMGLQRFDIERGIVISISLIRLAATLWFLQAESGLLILACIFLGITLLENILTCVFAYRLLPTLELRWRHLRPEVYRSCFGFSCFSFLSLISEHLIYLVDTIVIGFVLGPQAVVPYYIASRLCDMVRAPLSQIGNVFLPRAGQLDALKQSAPLRGLVLQGMGFVWLFAAAAWIGAYGFADQLIALWIGPGYDQSHLFLLILLAGQLVAMPTHLLRQVLTGIGQVRVPALLFLAEAVLNLALSLLLMQWWGLYGVAWGTLLPILFVECLFLLPYAMQVLQISFRELYSTALAPQGLPLGLLLMYAIAAHELITQLVAPGWLSLLSVAVGALLTLGAGVWVVRRQSVLSEANVLESPLSGKTSS